MNLEFLFAQDDFTRHLLISFGLFLVVTTLRFYIVYQISRSRKIPLNDRRQWIVAVKSVLLFIFFIGLIVTWAEELRTFAVSLVAVAAAFVIAFKEVIMNVSGYFSRVSAKPFSIGDRIEVNGTRGDVIDQNLFFTKILEIGPGQITNQYTGRSINIPNSMFLTHSIINESFTHDYTLHVFVVPVVLDKDFLKLRDHLLKSAIEVCGPHQQEARKAFEHFGRTQALEVPNVEPRVQVRFVTKDQGELIVRVPAQTALKGRIEQDILKKFSDYYIDKLGTLPAVAPTIPGGPDV